jgi:hypothetical protein
VHPTAMTVQRLEAARPALLGLQAALLDAERRERERVRGTMARGTWYAAVLEDETLAWLRPISQLVAGLDDAMAEAVRTETPLPAARIEDFARRARACVTPGPRYLELLQAHPEVILAHRDAVRALAPPPSGSGSADRSDSGDHGNRT